MRKGKADYLQFFRLIFNTLLLILVAGMTLFAQPELKVKLKDSVVVSPARPNDTIFYKLDIENISNEDIKQLLLNRSGDPNTSLVPGSFQSTPIAIPLAGLTLLEDQVATITLGGLDPDGDPLTFTIIQAPQNGALSGLNPSSITESTIDYQPNTDFIGNDMFAFAVEDDDGNRDTSLIELIIQSVNDAPSFTADADISILEDAGAQAIPWAMDISAGPADEIGQALTFNILSNNNADLFENQPEIASDGTLTFTAKTDSNGEAELVIQLMDNGGTANGGIDTSLRQTLLISVLSVNDAPSFTADADISILEDAGAQVIPWATDINAGPADENGQALTFNILSNNNADLFENQPEIASDGTLTFTAKADANGEAELVIQLMDNGGTANGGIDTSLRQTLLISVLWGRAGRVFGRGRPFPLGGGGGAHPRPRAPRHPGGGGGEGQGF
ncbi:MAG: hypothetical protein IPJ74_12100 [Saprospiraceae bacterium]|nr:hypothetical protein [Saprospiraceae bacterium]